METYMAFKLRSSSHPILCEVASDCIPSTIFSHNSEDPTTALDAWYYTGLRDLAPITKVQTTVVDGRDEKILAGDQQPYVRGRYPLPPYAILKRSIPPPTLCSSLPMDGSLSPEHGVPGLLPKLLPPPHGVFLRAQPPSPPLETPELVQRSLPALEEPLPAPRLPLSTQDLPEVFDVDMRDAELAQPSISRLCQRSQMEEFLSSDRRCLWLPAHTDNDVASSSGSSTSTSVSRHLELLTPVTPTAPWITTSSLYPEEPLDCMNDLTFGDSLSDWDAGGYTTCDALPGTSRHRSRSLELPETNGFVVPSPPRSSFSQPVRAYTSPPQFVAASEEDLEPLWAMNVDDATAPRSPLSSSLLLPEDDFVPREYLQDHLSIEVDPPPPSNAPAPLSLQDSDARSLPDLYNGAMYISPASPRGFTTRLPDFEMEDDSLEPPSSPRSPCRELLPMEDDEMFVPPSTISPSLLVTQSSEGLGLFIRPSSIDPPLARSPSPDEDDLLFLDVQLDSASTDLPVDEFLQLRAVRRRALDAERVARSVEAELAERVSVASDALLPSRAPRDPVEKRLRKHELHVAMEMRADARKARKEEKQRSKEIGALLDLKMERHALQGKTVVRSVAQLVAKMVLKRREVYRPLATRKPASAPPSRVGSPLRTSVSVEDLMEDDDAF